MATLPPLPAGFWPVPAGHLAAVVTHLEMTAPPPPRAVPTLGRPLVLERLDPADLAGYRARFRAVGEPWLWFSRLRLSDAALRAILADARVEAYAVADGTARVGLLELDFREPGQGELARGREVAADRRCRLYCRAAPGVRPRRNVGGQSGAGECPVRPARGPAAVLGRSSRFLSFRPVRALLSALFPTDHHHNRGRSMGTPAANLTLRAAPITR